MFAIDLEVEGGGQTHQESAHALVLKTAHFRACNEGVQQAIDISDIRFQDHGDFCFGLLSGQLFQRGNVAAVRAASVGEVQRIGGLDQEDQGVGFSLNQHVRNRCTDACYPLYKPQETGTMTPERVVKTVGFEHDLHQSSKVSTPVHDALTEGVGGLSTTGAGSIQHSG